MFPSQAAARAMTTVTQLREHYRLADGLWEAFVARAGDPGDDIRLLAAMPPRAIAVACEAAEILPPGEPLTAMQATHVGLVYRLARRICWINSGGEWLEWVDPNPWETTRGDSEKKPVEEPVEGQKTRKLKLSNILDQMDDSEFMVEPEEARQKWLRRFKEITGGYPLEEEEPTLEQVSAIKRKVDGGLAPFADFSIFVPYGKRAMKTAKYRSYQLDPSTGGYTVKELLGPSSFGMWLLSFRVYKVSLVMLDLVEYTTLNRYENHMERLSRMYAGAWHLLVTADERARGEQSSRVKSRIAIDLEEGRDAPVGWSEKKPWNFVLLSVLEDEKFWREQVHTPALAWLATGAKGLPLTPEERFMQGTHLGDKNQGGAQKEWVNTEEENGRKRSNKERREARKKRARSEREELERWRSKGGEKGGSKGDGKKGKGKREEKCYSWNYGSGVCKGLAAGEKCKGPVTRTHSCLKCGSPGHPAVECPGTG